MDLQNVSIAFISRFHFHYSPHSTDSKWCLLAIQKITKAVFATPTKQFLLAGEEFSSKSHITQQHGTIERENCIYLTFSISLFTSFNRQELMFVADSKDNRSYLRDTNKTILLADEQFSSKTHITQQHGITEREFCVYLTFSFSLSTTFNRQEVMFVCDSKDKKTYLCDTNETKFLLADEEFSSKKTKITEQHGLTEREYCVYLTFSFSLFTSFNRQ